MIFKHPRAFTCILILLSSVLSARTTLIYVGNLLPIPGEGVLTQQTIVVDGKTITKIVSGYVDVSGYPKGIKLFKKTGAYLVPTL